MKFYVTTEDTIKLKRSFLNLKLFSIINIKEILENYKYNYETMNEYESFIVANEIMAKIKNYTKSKRIRGIIYCNPYLNKEISTNLNEIIKDYEKISEIVLLDDYNVPKLQHLYEFFSEIIFYPSIKKIRLIECKTIADKIDWKN